MDALLRDPCCLLGLGALGVGGLTWLGFAVLAFVRGRIQRAHLVEDRIMEKTR